MKKTKLDNQNKNQKELADYRKKAARCLEQGDIIQADNNSQNEESESGWCDADELCKRHPELSKSKVVSRQWRLDNDFPFNSGYKCRQIYYEPDVVDWINKHLRTNKC